jgi:hypothetical protein
LNRGRAPRAAPERPRPRASRRHPPPEARAARDTRAPTSPCPRCLESAPATPPYAHAPRTAGPSAVSSPHACHPSRRSTTEHLRRHVAVTLGLQATYKSRPFSPPRAIPAAPPAIAAAAVSSPPRSRSLPADHSPRFPRPRCTSHGRLLSKPVPSSPFPPSRRGHRRQPLPIPLAGRPFHLNSCTQLP